MDYELLIRIGLLLLGAVLLFALVAVYLFV